MKQRILAAFLSLALCLGGIAAAAPAHAFTDADDPALSEAVAVLSGMGVVDGYADGAYHPDDALTRAQFCKLSVLLEGHGDQAVAGGSRALFSDLPASHWAAGYVNLAYSEGLISGYGDGTFGPDDPVTLAQAVTMLLHILGYENADIGPFWPEDYLSKAAKLGLTDGFAAASGDALTRGQAALLLYHTLKQDTAAGKSFLSTWAASTVENAVLLDVSADSDDGRSDTAQVYAAGAFRYYDQENALPEALAGRRGTLLLDKSGGAAGFVPDGTAHRTVAVSRLTADGVTDANGNTYALPSGLTVLADGEKSSWGERWFDLDGRASLTLLYSASGSIDLAVFSESEKYAGVLLTGCYENASPSAAAPTTITLLGHTFDVADSALKTLKGFRVGDKITIALNGQGEVAAAYDATDRKTTNIGVLTQVSGATGKVELLSGVEISGALTSSAAADLEGTLVKVTSSGVGKIAVSKLSGSSTSYKWDVANRTVGRLTVSERVKVYDQVGGSAVTEVEAGDILLDTVPADAIAYVGADASGEVDLLILNDVTGNCYTYGWLKAGVQSGGSGDMAYSNHTVAVENSAGTGSPCLTGSAVRQNAAGGLAVTPAGKAAGVVYLTGAEASRTDFSGTDTVLVDGYYIPVSEAVEVYNETTGTWTTLEEARAFTGQFTVYYDRTPATGGQIRLIVAE